MPVLFDGHNLPTFVEMGLSDLQKSWGPSGRDDALVSTVHDLKSNLNQLTNLVIYLRVEKERGSLFSGIF